MWTGKDTAAFFITLSIFTLSVGINYRDLHTFQNQCQLINLNENITRTLSRKLYIRQNFTVVVNDRYGYIILDCDMFNYGKYGLCGYEIGDKIYCYEFNGRFHTDHLYRMLLCLLLTVITGIGIVVHIIFGRRQYLSRGK